MDFNRLIELFPNLKRVHSPLDGWFSFQIQGQLYAIPEAELTAAQKQLILVFADQDPLHSNDEQKWLEFLNQYDTVPPRSLPQSRLIVMQLKHGEHPKGLKESIAMLLNKPVLFFWNKPNLLVLLEELKPSEEPIPFDQIIDVMSDDLDLNLKLLVSETIHSMDELPSFYEWLVKTAEEVFQETSKRLINQSEALLLLLPKKYSSEERRILANTILQNSIDDSDLIKTIKTVIEHQGNVSAASKSLYMHRNSVQYRLDKFQELTGRDIKNFNDMLNVYLAIQLIE